MKYLCAAALMCAACLPASSQEAESEPIALPLEGLTAACCEAPVEKALGKIENVASVKLRKDGNRYFADVGMKKGRGLAMSDIDKALAVANKEMGEAMGTKYKVSDSLGASPAYLFTTKSEPDEAKLKEALGSLKGFQSVRIEKGGFGATFEGDSRPGVAEVRKAAGIEITDVILAAARYSCPMHPAQASLEPGKCAVCGMPLARITDARAKRPDEGGKQGGCHGKDNCKNGCGDCDKGCGRCGEKEDKGCGGCNHDR